MSSLYPTQTTTTTTSNLGGLSSLSGVASTGVASTGFTNTNSLVSKFVFIFIVLFAFLILLHFGISIIGYFLKPSESPKLINGMIDAKQFMRFPQDPNEAGSVTIYRSVNANDGIEFTWSVWIYIDNLQYNEGSYRHIFHKGNKEVRTLKLDDDVQVKGMIFPNNAPGLYIAPNTNALVVRMNTFDVINEETIIPDIPLNKWINVIIRCQNKTMDVYINGTITRSVELHGVPKQNYGDVFVAMNGGFDGNISNLWYYNYALGTAAIQQLARKGPNMKMIGSGNSSSTKNLDYLSLRWFVGDNMVN